MTLQELDNYMTNPHTSGQTHYAQCPICEAGDSKGHHLYYSVTPDGKPLMHCKKSSCRFEDIAKALGIQKDTKRTARESSYTKRTKLREHIYKNADNTIFAKKIIWKTDKGKSATWQIYINGRYENGLKGEKSPLYNLPCILSSDKIYIAEGEKDVDTLTHLGFCATTSPNGASKDSTGAGNWRASDNKHFAGKEVVILQDNDDAGKKHALATAREVSKVAASVKILDLLIACPGLPDKADITDLYEIYAKDDKWTTATIQALEASTPPLLFETNDAPEFFDGRRFKHNVMGDYIIKKHGVCKINNAIHVYENGIYKQGREHIHGLILNICPDLTDKQREEVYKYIKVNQNTPTKKVSPPYLIPFKTRIYDIKNDRFIDYSPEHVFLNRFPYDYIPDAPECDSVTSTICAVAEHDKDVISLLYEAMGNCFYMLNSFRGAVALYGQSGNNGKSTLLNMVTRLVGRENACYLSLQDTAERFRLAEVYGKAANIGDDISAEYLKDSSLFKKLVTGEVITAEKKGQDPFNFRPYAKMFFAMNELPPVSDKSKAFFGRLLLIPLNHDFSKGQANDTGLKDREWTLPEMEYLTRCAVEGLKRLLHNGNFTRPESVKNALEEYERENNPIIEFLEEYGEVTDKRTKEVYNAFCVWNADMGHRCTFTHTKFTREVKRIKSLTSNAYRTDTDSVLAQRFSVFPC